MGKHRPWRGGARVEPGGHALVPRRAGEPVAMERGGQLVRRDAVDHAARRRRGGRGRGRWAGRGGRAACRRRRRRYDGADPAWSRCGRVAVGEPEAFRVGRWRCAARRPASRLRHAGSRKIVLAVNERRSPADSRNGHSALVAGRARRASRQLGEQLGDVEVHDAVVGVARRRHVASRSSSVNTTPDGLSRMASNSRSPASGPVAEAGAVDAVGFIWRAALGERPQRRGGRRHRAAGSGRACGTARPARPARARAWPRRRRRMPRRTRRGRARRPRAAARCRRR